MLRILALLALSLPFAVGAADAAKIVQQGNGGGAAPCMACHGTDGGGMSAAGNPRLAGLNAAYIQRQLDDFANGTRSSPIMQPNAKALSEDERAALATYYSALPIPARLAAPGAKPDAAGEALATRGDWHRGVPGCVKCHGTRGIGVGANFPPLAGQPAAYIEAQLRDWQQGSRRNDPLQLMQHIAKPLTTQEIAAVAEWFAAQPLPTKEGTP